MALFADRGFTSHEYLPWYKLYNMNGRLYNHLAVRFLSADSVIQDGASTQNYNRYSYCLNNPLKFTDPSGYQIRKSEADAWAEAMTDRNDFFMINSGGGSGVGMGASTPHIYRMRQESIAQDASGGWRYDESTGTYSNIFTGESGWDNAFNSLQQSDRILERYGMAQTAYIENGRKIGNGDYYWVRLGHGVESTGLYPTFTSRQSGLDFKNSFNGQNNNLGENRNFELGHNYFGDRYTGGNNPIGYSLPPLNPRDAISMEHDKGYDAFGAKGPKSVFTNGYVLPVDYKFIKEQYKLGFSQLAIGLTQPNGTGGYFIQQGFYSILAGTGIGIPALLKTVFINPYRTF